MLTLFLTGPLLLAGDLRPLLFSAVLVALPTMVTLLQLALSRSREYVGAILRNLNGLTIRKS